MNPPRNREAPTTLQNAINWWVRAICKPGSVPREKARRWPFIWDHGRPRPHAVYPDDGPEAAPEPKLQSSLSDLAPGGACRAAPVAGGAVSSYLTVSPLPAQAPAVWFSVALSLKFEAGAPPSPGVTRHRSSVEPGLSSRQDAPRGHPIARLA